MLICWFNWSIIDWVISERGAPLGVNPVTMAFCQEFGMYRGGGDLRGGAAKWVGGLLGLPFWGTLGRRLSGRLGGFGLVRRARWPSLSESEERTRGGGKGGGGGGWFINEPSGGGGWFIDEPSGGGGGNCDLLGLRRRSKETG